MQILAYSLFDQLLYILRIPEGPLLAGFGVHSLDSLKCQLDALDSLVVRKPDIVFACPNDAENKEINGFETCGAGEKCARDI